MTLDLPSLLKATLEAGGSDLHLATGQPPLVRLRGKMIRSQAPPLAEAQARDLVYSVMSEEQRRSFEDGAEIDFAFELPGLARFRANVFRQRHGVSAVYRVIISRIRTLEELGTPPILRDSSRDTVKWAREGECWRFLDGHDVLSLFGSRSQGR